MPNSKIRLLVLCFLLFVFLFQAGPVFALEINWPSLPGTTAPQAISQQPKDQQLPLLFNYFLHFFYFLSVSAAIVVLIYAGLLYLFSGSRPAVLVEARARISQALLGLFILLGSYLILAVINPQLLVFKTRISSPPPIPTVFFKNPPKELTYLQVPIGSNLQKILTDLNETKTYEGDNKKYPTVEIPILRIKKTLDETIETMETLKKQISNCRCGLSNYYITVKKGKGECLPGKKNPEEATTDKGICLNSCQDCGSKCDTREVRRDPDSTDTIQVYDETKKDWVKITDDDKKTAIKYSRLKLTELLAKLKTQSVTLSTDEIDLIAKNLGINAGEVLSSDLEQISFQGDFLSEKRELEKGGYKVNLKRPKQFPQPKVVHMSPAALDPFTIYAPLKGDLFPENLCSQNQETYQLSQRASLFSVLSQLSLEDIENMIQDCLNSAFGQGNFNLPTADLASIVQKTIQQGVANYLGQTISENSADYSAAFLNQLRQETNDKISSPSTKANLLVQCQENCAGESDCQAQCQKKTIPTNFLSNKLADLMTKSVKDQLPKEIKKTLDENVRKGLLSGRVNNILTASTVSLLDNVFQGALKKRIKDQIPFLKENLQKTTAQIMPEVALIPLQTIDYFLLSNLKTLKKRINNQIAAIAKRLGEELSKPATALIENYKKKNPNLFSDARPPSDCFKDFNDGYYYDYAQKKCAKATLQDIQDFADESKISAIEKNVSTAEDENDWDRSEAAGEFSSRDFCLNSGYCWDEKAPRGKKCDKCQWIDVKGLKPTKSNLKNLLSGLWRGLVNFAEQFVVALTQTVVYTLTQYTQVWVEDTFIVPIQPYLTQLTDFSKNLHKFLYSSVEQLLPQQIDQYLSSDIDHIMQDVCNKSKQTPEGGTVQLARGWDVEVSKEVGDKACNISQEFHKSIMDRLNENCTNDPQKDKSRLGCLVGRALEGSFYDLFCGSYDPTKKPDDCVLSFLNKSFAEILLPQIKNIDEIIKGTPKQIICSELKLSDQSYKETCSPFKTSGLSGGLLPYPKGNGWNNLEASEKAYCYFLWYGCQNPFHSWTSGIGSIVKNILDNNCQNQQNDFCNAADKDSLGYTLFYYGLQANQPANDQEEIETYQWLAVTFPDLISDIDKLANNRGLLSQWTDGNPSPREQAVRAGKLDDLPLYRQNGNAFARAFVNWFAKNNTLSEVLTSPNLGIMSSLEGNYRRPNVLGRTPYQFIHDGVCRKIKSDFQKDYPDWAFSAVKANLTPTNAPPYSMEGLNRPTIAKTLNKILSASDLPSNRRDSYIGCLLLDFSPAQIFGLDQKLVRYVQPKEYQVMFDLIKNELKSDERPEGLNRLLDYLYNRTPVDLLKTIGQNKNNEDMKNLSDFLGTAIGKQINKGGLNKQIVRLIFGEGLLNQKLGWQEWQKVQDILSQTPAQLAASYLTQPLISPNAKWAKRSLMDYLADPDGIPNSGDETFLGKRYIDSLGRRLGLDKPIYNLYLNERDFYDNVDKAVVKTKKSIQGALDKALLDYPKAGLNWLANGLGGAAGTSLAENMANQFSGSCRKAQSASDCQEGEAFNNQAKECCSLGAGLACLPRCRPKPAEEGCDIEAGESPSSDGTQCCFDDNCSKCRLLNSGEETCKRDKEEEKPRTINVNGNEKKICCKPRELKTKNGQDFCCVSITECVSDKFTPYLERMGSMLRDGPALNELSK